MDRARIVGAAEARNQLKKFLDAAEEGRTTIITKHGRAVAALVPVDAFAGAVRQHSILPLEGSGRGLWGRNSALRIRQLREEWSR
jgi:prevent-host-death family protein